MGPGRDFFAIDVACAAGGDDLDIVGELEAETDRLDVIVIHALAGLVGEARIKGIAFAEQGVAKPNTVSALHTGRLGGGHSAEE